ncbi:hypothetical protein HD597_011307 [Nonomuraea thailandensis]|uniref:Uncharacterized protein n=1 Tax=Nonomuraea thailandensis TaxID=1188745 RepID=A0A9X2GUV9_9ACTN|nr:hypothetical protein [Nonomuraea thailandensis]MCP2364287.1 hypothetical protein [Nonomuraea thailandensis]
MSKQTGLGDAFWLDGYDLSGDVGALGRIGGGLAGTQDMTGINKSAMERAGLARDGALEWTSFFNPGTAAAHEVLSTLPFTNRIATYGRGTGLGSPAACLIGRQINYDPSRAADGSLTISVQALADGYGLEWGRQLTAGVRTDTGAANGASVDFGAVGSFGLQAWLHVTAFTGTDATIRLQQSSDDGGADAFANVTGGAFTQVTAGPTSERIQTARGQAVERYLRVVTSTSGGFSSLSFVVVVSVNPVSVVF